MLTKKELHVLAKATVEAFEEEGHDAVWSDELDLAKGYLALETQLRSLKRKYNIIARVVKHEKWCGSDDDTPGCCRSL